MIDRIVLKNVDSTNRFLKSLNTASLPNFFFIRADFQSNGRGRKQNKWESEMGKNLLISVLFRPQKVVASSHFIVSQIVSLAVADVLEKLCSPNHLAIKWPNDIYIGNKKIAGILIENTFQGAVIKESIVGIGLNINQLSFSSALPNPTSLALEFNCFLSPSVLAVNLIEKLKEVASENPVSLQSRYLALLYQRGIFRPFKNLKNGENFVAKIVSIDDFGRLCLLTEDEKSFVFELNEIAYLSL